MTNADKIKQLPVGITDSSFQEGLIEIINNLKGVEIDTFSMNDSSFLQGQEDMLNEVINYLERCL